MVRASDRSGGAWNNRFDWAVPKCRDGSMDFEGHISESAFLVNESRARNVDLSKDRFATLWVGDATRGLWEAFSAEVYPHDAIELGLRNRFFLERLSSFVDSHSDAAFVNIGAGFTSYPLLIDSRADCTEIDFQHVIEFKKERLIEWAGKGLIPRRSVSYVGCDVAAADDRKRLEAAITSVARGRPSFVLIEGLTYYLPRDLFVELLGIVREAQAQRSVLAFDFWEPEFAAYPVFLRFERFFAKRFGVAERRYNFMDREYVASIKDYKVAELKSVQELERLFSDTRVLQDPGAILPESYALLIKGGDHEGS
jgi:O-methyltransferase involved in polyketide biosynthesis